MAIIDAYIRDTKTSYKLNVMSRSNVVRKANGVFKKPVECDEANERTRDAIPIISGKACYL